MPDLESSFAALPICKACGGILTSDDVDIHIHHDSDICLWLPCPPDGELEIMLHEIECEHLALYHSSCCKKCGFELAGI